MPPIDANSFNYFLMILGGFGFVWSYRNTLALATGIEKRKITEFEYAAFSALWGVFIFTSVTMATLYAKVPSLTTLYDTIVQQAPFIGAIPLFIIGVAAGTLLALIVDVVTTSPKVITQCWKLARARVIPFLLRHTIQLIEYLKRVLLALTKRARS
jgi:magnesium-transporting ATPase (P-type)